MQLPPPAVFVGDVFRDQLRGAGHADAEVLLYPDHVEVTGVDEAAEPDVAAALEAHPATVEEARATAETERTNEADLRAKAADALAANRADIDANDTFLAITSPTNQQVLAQVQELTRQSSRQARELNGLVRLVLNRFDGTD